MPVWQLMTGCAPGGNKKKTADPARIAGLFRVFVTFLSADVQEFDVVFCMQM
jgi:hypothetical protein